MTEHDICKELVKWRNSNVYRYSCLKLLYHVANEGKRDRRKAKELGMWPGLPDYHMPALVWNNGILIYAGFWLEIKSYLKKPTQRQLDTMEILRTECKQYVVWIDDLQTAIDITEQYCKWVHEGDASSK